ncbi:hypothetical protein LAZ67_2005665 [Cordylochernes scorpioides]|uniref:Polyprotein n=1 Tax=Cordylochernes scorpioides TaxID=51811 RepID=A0ABY6K4R8_9ARAC|nr:hypothetical protein LAZ67_2005665 [Cordylochernes scorpioides]
MNDSMKDYIARIMNIHRKLEKGGHGFKDTELALIMLMGLPKTYEPMILNLEQNEEKLSMKIVKAKLLLEEKRQLRHDTIEEETTSRAFVIKEEKQPTFHERRKYHPAEKTQEASTSHKYQKNTQAKAVKYFCCGKMGHIAKNCIFNLAVKERFCFTENKEQAKRLLSNPDKISKQKAFFFREGNRESHLWYLDSGATEHMVSDRSKLTNIREISSLVETANKQSIHVTEMGDITFKVNNKNGGGSLFLKNVLIVPEIEGNLLSVGRIEKLGNNVIFENGNVKVLNQQGELLVKAPRNGNTYYIEEFNNSARITKVREDIWHRCLGHLNKEAVAKMNIGEKRSDNQCTVCMESKMKKLPFSISKSGIPITFWGDAIHTACHLRNKSPSKAIDNKIPEELWSGRESKIGYLKVFGCKSWCSIDDCHCKSKFSPKAKECVLIGYPEGTKGYKVWDFRNDKICHKKLQKNQVPLKKLFVDLKLQIGLRLFKGNYKDWKKRELGKLFQGQLTRVIDSKWVFNNEVCLLKKSIYGLKQSGHEWNEKLDQILTSIGLERSRMDPCIYFSKDIILGVYVDDLLVTTSSVESYVKFKSSIQGEVDIKDLGEVSDLLSKSLRSMEWKEASTPLDPGMFTEGPGGKEACHAPYQQAIGNLLWLAGMTRPDIAYAVSYLSKFNSSPLQQHWNAVKHLLRCLKKTKDLKLVFSKTGKKLAAFADADWGSDKEDRKSYSGYIFVLGGAAISWCSRKQKCVALSTAEAEYYAMCEAAKEALWFTSFMEEIGVGGFKEYPLKTYIDNQGTMFLAENEVVSERS